MIPAAFALMLAFCLVFPRTMSAAEAVVEINSRYFPDKNFREALTAYDTDADGKLVISQIKSLDLVDKDIHNLQGIEYFTGLTELICSNNQLSRLELRKNTALTVLYCDGNKLTGLNLVKNTKLETLNAASNTLTSIDLSKNKKLKTLVLRDNQLKKISLKTNTALTGLDVSGNLLTSLDLKKNKKLATLECFGNKLKKLDLSKNTKLKELYCDENQISSLKIRSCRKLTYLDCGQNKLTSLDLKKNTSLTTLFCNDNRLKKLDLSKTGFKPENLEDTLLVDQTTVITWKDKSRTVQADYVGKTVKVKSAYYRITKMCKEVSFLRPTSKSAKTITIPATIKIRGISYKVTSVSADAAKEHKNLTYLIVGKNVKQIGKEAFASCTKLKRVTFQGSKVKTVDENAFAFTRKNLTIKAPASCVKNYKTLLTAAGAVIK